MINNKERITFTEWYKIKYGIEWKNDWIGIHHMLEEFIYDYKEFCLYENEDQLDIIIDI